MALTDEQTRWAVVAMLADLIGVHTAGAGCYALNNRDGSVWICIRENGHEGMHVALDCQGQVAGGDHGVWE